ncbi:hypothetical protein [Qipengyuania nanhaisediminis]|uniref:hypothetical protein n=1 Tax=Qipengyuania nanhaisediminis TaxID=604088 RepID=UPI0038B2C82D
MIGNAGFVSELAIELVRNLHNKLTHECHTKGVTFDDIALVSTVDAFDVAEKANGLRLLAMEWMLARLKNMTQAFQQSVSTDN